jgi:hypothetical protein
MRTFLIVLSFYASHLFAQSPDEILLDRQLRSYEVKFKNLMATRGLNYHEGEVDKVKLLDVIGSYCEDSFGEKNPDAAVLFYHFENDTLYHWLLDVSGVRARTQLPVTIDSLLALENTLKYNVYRDNRFGDLSDEVRGQYQATTKKYRIQSKKSIPLISEILFPPPVATVLATKKYLVILPILNLSSFPYALLRPWRSDKTLIDQLSFSFAHNFSQFFKEADPGQINRNYRLSGGKGIFQVQQPLVIGNPLFADGCTKGLAPLPGAEEEATRVARLLHTTATTQANVKLKNIVGELPRTNIIYLATHGWADTSDPLDKSYIALYDSGGCGFLTPRKIQELRLAKEPLVFLSACQSGLGSVHDAGIIGLARGFLKAGAQSITMSLWNVDDQETATLMHIYLEELQKPHLFFPAEHWRQAVLRYQKEHKKDPMYWAAFQNFGVPFRLLAPTYLQP